MNVNSTMQNYLGNKWYYQRVRTDKVSYADKTENVSFGGTYIEKSYAELKALLDKMCGNYRHYSATRGHSSLPVTKDFVLEQNDIICSGYGRDERLYKGIVASIE